MTLPPLSTLLLALWAMVATAILGSLALSFARLRWTHRRLPRMKNGPVWEAAQRVASRLGVTPAPVLLEGDAGIVPMTWGIRRPVLLMPADAMGWEPWRLEAVILHELGHFQRRDFLSQVAAQVACAFYWFNPLVWVAAHRMWIEREHACDDLVVSAGHDAPRYANDLLTLARSLRPARTSGAMAFGMARSERLRDRLLAILDENRSRHPLTRRGALGTGALALVAACGLATLTPAAAVEKDQGRASEEAAQVLAAPQPTSELPPATRQGPRVASEPHQSTRPTILCGPADGEAHRRASLTDDDVRRIEAEFGACRSSVRVEGEIEFTEDFSAIARLSSGARMRIEVERPGYERRLDVRPGSGGRPEYTWQVDGRNSTFGAADEEWLEAVLLELFRSSNFMAEERAAWILSQEGPEGIFAEVQVMTAGYTKAAYLTILMEEGELSQAQVRRLIELAGREIESDHSLGQILTATAERYDLDPTTRTAFLEAARSIESDHTQGQIFLTALSREDLSSDDVDLLLRTASESIESDYTLGQILQELAARYSLEPRFREPFLRAASTIESDHTQGQVYGLLLQQEGLTPGELAAILDAATGIESDHTLGELLQSVARHDLSQPELRQAFLRGAASVESDYTRGQVYREALGLGGLSDQEMASILEAVGQISSDHELSSLLVEVASRGISGPTLHRAYLDAAGKIESDYSLAEALSAFARMDNLGTQSQIDLLRAARSIESDHSLAEFLIGFAGLYPVEGTVREAFLDAMDTIESEHSRGRVASVLVRGRA